MADPRTIPAYAAEGWEFDAAVVGSILAELDEDTLIAAVHRCAHKVNVSGDDAEISSEKYYRALDMFYSALGRIQGGLC